MLKTKGFIKIILVIRQKLYLNIQHLILKVIPHYIHIFVNLSGIIMKYQMRNGILD